MVDFAADPKPKISGVQRTIVATFLNWLGFREYKIVDKLGREVKFDEVLTTYCHDPVPGDTT